MAARLESLADAGGICVSEVVYQQVKGKLDVGFEDLGAQTLKNLAEPVRVYRINLALPAAAGRAASRAPPPLSDKPSLAVLPFVNMSGDPEQDYFSDGLTEDMITELSRFRSLSVIAWNSPHTHSGRAVKAQDVGRELGVAFVVEGSVRRAGQRVRVSAQLIEAASGKHVWADRYDRDFEDIFAVQDEITQTIAATIGGRVEAEGRQRVARLHPKNLKAYDYVLHGQALYYQVSKQAHGEASALLQKAIALDPHSARAHMLLAAVHDMGYWTNWVADPGRSLERARRYGKKAVSLDDADSLARAFLGEILLHSGDREEAEIQFQKALDLNPYDTAARALYGSFLCATGRTGEAIEQLTIAKRMDPFELSWIPWMRGVAYFTARRYEDAVMELKKVETPINNVRGWLAASYAHAGRPEDARAALRDFLETAKTEMVVFPETLEDWQEFWRRAGEYDDEEDFRHLFDGLREAGLGA